VKLAAPEDGPLESKHVVLHMLINNCVDGGIYIYIDYFLVILLFTLRIYILNKVVPTHFLLCDVSMTSDSRFT
jgi:hypothetical protein